MVNSIVFQGRMVRDAELKSTQTGIKHMSFTVAWSEKYKETERRCYLRCKAWRQTAEFIDKYFHNKGSEMLLEGQLETEEYTDSEGNKKSNTVMNVNRVHFCGKRQDGAQPAEPAPAPEQAYVPADGEELPF